MYAEAIVEHHTYTARGGHGEPKPWIIDSGCSAHFSPNQSEFIAYTPYASPHQIHLGGSRAISLMGEGTMSLVCLIDGKLFTHLIHSVQYVPDLSYTLLSCCTLTHHGLTTTFKDDGCKIYHKDGVVIAESSQMPNQLYFLNVVKRRVETMPDNNAALTAAPLFDLAHK